MDTKPKGSPEPTWVALGASEWRPYLHQHPAGTIYHDPRWGQIMEAAYGNRPLYLTARRGAQVVGTLQLIRQRGLLSGSHLCSVPYFDAAGVLADDDEARRQLVAEAQGLLRESGGDWVELRQLEPLCASLSTRSDKIALWLTVPAGSEAMWKQLKPKVRTKVRKSQKHGLQVIHGGAELLAEFHATYSRSMRELGSPPHGQRFFRLILERFGDAAEIFVVRAAGVPAAASFTLRDRHALRVPWSGSHPALRYLGANRLLYWSMLERAADLGAPAFDFGRSTRGSGTHEFKKEWGARDVPLYWHFLLPEGGAVPDLRPDNPRYKLLVACWKRLPLWLVGALGPRIVGRLS